ncbi:hypothetical protein BC830DRAFT_1054984, partial [Chytriomyces sp. MP71]
PLRIGCVPEHFSIPFFHTTTAATNPFEVTSCPGGTGQMLKMLESGEIDVCVGLTEGLVAALAKGTPANGFKIVGSLTRSPLTWSVVVSPKQMAGAGIFAGCAPGENNAAWIRGRTIGISRFGSGSHLIPYVIPASANADTPASTRDYKFVQLNDIIGLRQGIASGEADAFLWERFTTKKYVDSGELALLGEVTPPWPAFLFACRAGIADGDERVRDFLDSVSSAINTGVYDNARAVRQGIVPEICDKFGYAGVDVESWFETVEFARNCKEVDVSAVERCLGALKSAGVL